jgi:two-component system response regulator HydG
MAHILIVDDDVTFCLMLKKLLEKHQYQVTTSFSAEGVKQMVSREFYDLVLTDLRMPNGSGMDLIGVIKQESPKTQIIMMTGYANIPTAIQSIKQGAFNYIPKPFQPEEVLNLLKEALQEGNKKSTLDNGSERLTKPKNYLEGISEVSRRLKDMIAVVAPTNFSVLITGESGTGKEFIARSIHQQSSVAQQPFVAVDCGAIPRELVASEFFGHVKGSFTGAISDKIGHFEAANGGTLFLDEVGNLPYDTQIQLLRTLQERKIKPVGSNKEVAVNVRIIAATNENLQTAKEKGHFREDLYHRLNEFLIDVPSLRDRGEDIMLFAHHFLKHANDDLHKTIEGFQTDVENVFMSYNWPGNLREMKNVVKRATLLAKGNQITMDEIPSEIVNQPPGEDRFKLFSEKNEDDLIRTALQTVGYNKSRAARLLKIDRKTLYNKLKQYHIDIPERMNHFDSDD